jgi:hypothetical protein
MTVKDLTESHPHSIVVRSYKKLISTGVFGCTIGITSPYTNLPRCQHLVTVAADMQGRLHHAKKTMTLISNAVKTLLIFSIEFDSCPCGCNHI